MPETEISAARFPVIDAHTHFGMHMEGEPFENNYDTACVVRELKSKGVCHCIDLTMYSRENWDRTLKKTESYKEFFSHCAPVDLSAICGSDFECRVVNEMEDYVRQGAVGFKIWKNLGLNLKDETGRLISVSDSRMDVVWETAARLDRPVVIHIADPPAFFEKADEYNERLEEIVNYPFWHHYYKGLSFQTYMRQLDELLTNHPATKILAAHLCSWPSNLDYVEKLLEAHQNLYTDFAAVISEIGRQPRRFKKFAEAYPDRILFGTDMFADANLQHSVYYRFLETEDEYFPHHTDASYEQGRWNIYGCGMRDELLKKLYYENAVNLFKLDEKALE